MRIGSKVRTFTRQPANRSNSSGRRQLPIQAGRTGLQRVRCAGNQVLHVEQNSKIAAERCAILVRHAGKLLHRQPASLPEAFPAALSGPQPPPSVARGPRRSFRESTRRVRSLAGPVNSMSTTSSPCEAATRSAAVRISSNLTAIVLNAPAGNTAAGESALAEQDPLARIVRFHMLQTMILKELISNRPSVRLPAICPK